VAVVPAGCKYDRFHSDILPHALAEKKPEKLHPSKRHKAKVDAARERDLHGFKRGMGELARRRRREDCVSGASTQAYQAAAIRVVTCSGSAETWIVRRSYS
jgi:hypothetical protein